MNRFIATTLLIGYVMLVPFCFFGNVMANDMAGMDMSGVATHQVSDCGMPQGACVGTATGAMGNALHHAQMYLSLSQTPLMVSSFVLMILTALFLVAVVAFSESLRIAPTFVRTPRRSEYLTQSGEQRFLNWLSLFESSPNFA